MSCRIQGESLRPLHPPIRLYIHPPPPCGSLETGPGLPEAGSGLPENGSGPSESGLGLFDAYLDQTEGTYRFLLYFKGLRPLQSPPVPSGAASLLT